MLTKALEEMSDNEGVHRRCCDAEGATHLEYDNYTIEEIFDVEEPVGFATAPLTPVSGNFSTHEQADRTYIGRMIVVPRAAAILIHSSLSVPPSEATIGG